MSTDTEVAFAGHRSQNSLVLSSAASIKTWLSLGVWLRVIDNVTSTIATCLR